LHCAHARRLRRRGGRGKSLSEMAGGARWENRRERVGRRSFTERLPSLCHSNSVLPKFVT
jgi:hypothetical protein